MAARSIGTGTVSFGMVSIPIKLYPTAESSAAISFNQLHDTCKSRLKQQYVCPKDNNEVVTREHIVKGYEFSKDQYVTFTEEELKAMAEEAQRAIEITEFVPAEQVDPIFFDGSYFLGPDKGGERAYKLLAQAMRETGRCALAKWAARGKMYLVLIRPFDKGIMMQQLHYADEVRKFDEVPVGDADLKDGELKLAVQLINQIASDEFKPQQYEDEVKRRYQAAIQRKVEGQEIITSAAVEPRAQVIDLMEALKASLASKAPSAGTSSVADEPRKPAKPAPRAVEAKAARGPRLVAGGKGRG